MCMDDFDWTIGWDRVQSWDGELGIAQCDCGHRFGLGEPVTVYGGYEDQHIDWGDVLGTSYSSDGDCLWCGEPDADRPRVVDHAGQLLMQDDYGNAFFHPTRKCHICRDDPENTLAIEHVDVLCQWCIDAMRWLNKACEGQFGWGDIHGQIAEHFGDEIPADEDRFPKTARLASLARAGWSDGGRMLPIGFVSSAVDEAIAELELVGH